MDGNNRKRDSYRYHAGFALCHEVRHSRGVTTLPMIFSSIIFIRSFANASKKDEALGANLIGALVGALLQSITFVTGIKALLLIVMGFYFLAMLTRPRTLYRAF